jgi:hypothetical protein
MEQGLKGGGYAPPCKKKANPYHFELAPPPRDSILASITAYARSDRLQSRISPHNHQIIKLNVKAQPPTSDCQTAPPLRESVSWSSSATPPCQVQPTTPIDCAKRIQFFSKSHILCAMSYKKIYIANNKWNE